MRFSKESMLRRLLATQDVCLSVLAYLIVIDVAYWLEVLDWSQRSMLLSLAPVILLLAIFSTLRANGGLASEKLTKQAWFAFRHTFIVVGGVLIFIYLSDIELSSIEPVMVSFTLLLGGGLLVDRLLLNWWYRIRRREEHSNYLQVLVVGSGSRARNLIAKYRKSLDWGLEVVGVLDPDPTYRDDHANDTNFLGGLEKIEDILSHQVIDEVLVCIPRNMIDDTTRIARACAEEGVCLKFVADIYDVNADTTVRLDHIDSLPILSFEPVFRDEGQLVAKRVIDLLLTILASPVLLPLMAAVAIAIKLDSHGPVLFIQRRVGLHKRQFSIFKFRSMFEDAESRLDDIEHLNEAHGPIFKIENDPRRTRIGGFLRRTSLDELPQFFNVLMGDMSLVGPRPMSLRDVDLFDRSVQRKRFSVRPGLICLREISGRSGLSFDRWLELDLQYIDEWSLWMDFKILLRAIPIVLRGNGAH